MMRVFNVHGRQYGLKNWARTDRRRTNQTASLPVWYIHSSEVNMEKTRLTEPETLGFNANAQ